MAIDLLTKLQSSSKTNSINIIKPEFHLSCSTNSKYAPHLPPIESDTAYNYVLILDKKFSLQPLLQAVEAIHAGASRIQESSTSQNRKPNVSE